MSKRKVSPTKLNNVNKDFCDMLDELASYEQNVSGNKFKANAYRKASKVLSKHDSRIQSGDEARKLEGVGAKIAKKIDEFIETGNLQKLEAIRTDGKASAISLLTGVVGIGPVKAKELVEKDGIQSLEDLRAHQDKLTHAQIVGLEHYEEFEERIPRDEMEVLESRIFQEIHALDKKITLTVCGSYRRGLPSSGDIDVLITHEDYVKASSAKEDHITRVVSALQSSEFITDTLSHGKTKFMGVCRLGEPGSKHRRLDILLLPKEQYYCGILYFTGSDLFNKQMRSHALERGFTLNEHSLRPLEGSGGAALPLEPLPVSSEEDIFDYISFDYKSPHERSL